MLNGWEGRLLLHFVTSAKRKQPALLVSVYIQYVRNIILIRPIRGVATGGISVYIGLPPPQISLSGFFMWLFCLLDPFIPTQIKFLATPLRPMVDLWTDVRPICPKGSPVLIRKWKVHIDGMFFGATS